jgi:NAD(P)-dependent dehydrogenase (short-subunit alcohol dehydrogenase family)
MSKSVAVVTGASQGIGRATAIRLAHDYSALVLVARNRANLEETAEKVRASGADALVIDADIAQPEAARAVVDRALATFDRIDALLNIAGPVPQIDLFRGDRCAVGGRPGVEAARRAAIDYRGGAGAESSQGFGAFDFGQLGPVSDGPVMTGRRRSYLQHWAPLHDMTVEERRNISPRKPGSRGMGSWKSSPS